MDARNIFIVGQTKLRSVVWEWPSPDSEWSYIGEVADLDPLDLQERIASFLGTPVVMLLTDRHNSREIPLLRASLEVRHQLRDSDVTICDESFSRFMVFSTAGVMKMGMHQAEQVGGRG